MGSTHLHISDRLRRGMAYPARCHEECELVLVENASGVRRIVGDSVEMAGEYDLVLVCSSECGFNNLSNFNRIFKKYRFCSPMELRERRIGVKKIV